MMKVKIMVVRPDGLCALLNLLDEDAAQPSLLTTFGGRTSVRCHHGRGAENA